MTQNRFTIAEVEALMQREDVHIDILPDGTVQTTRVEVSPDKPLTFRQDLPSNY